MEPVYFLLVDDLEENLIALEALLRREGLVLLKARSGQEALELLLKHEVALALVDVQMPGMDGFELAELMRGTERTRTIPIIFLTAGSADQQRRFRGYEAGAVDFLHKPIETDILISKTKVFYELYRQKQEVARLLNESRDYAAALKAADARKDEFLATMSHEIRTPMNAILGLSRILQMQPLNDEQAKIVDTLHSSANSLLLLINDLLDISKMEAASVILESAPFNLSELLQAIHDMLSVKAMDRGLDFQMHTSAIEGMHFMGDAERLKQILVNLCSNALKFTTEGSVKVQVDCTPPVAPDTTAHVTIAVTDSGIGIAPDKIASVFEKFVQADSSISRQYGGTGLGLSISKNLAEAMGGSLSVASELNVGSTFTLQLPLEVTDATSSPVTIEQRVPQSAPADAPTILLVEDHPPNVLVATLCLQEFGYSYDVAGSGPEAVEKAVSNDYAVILMDVQMPGMTGFEATAAIREEHANQGKSPVTIIGMTAHAMAGDREKCLEAGMDDYISKPLNLAELEELLARYCSTDVPA